MPERDSPWRKVLEEDGPGILRNLLAEPNLDEIDCAFMGMAMLVAILAIETRHRDERARRELAMAGSDVGMVWQFLSAHHQGMIDARTLARRSLTLQ